MENPVSLNESYLSSRGNSSNKNSGIVLETFCHQVGGRSLILTYDRDTVCKPLVPQELRFYLDLPQSLRPFTPHYKGVIKVDVQGTDEEKIKLIAKIRRSSDSDVNHNMDQKNCDSLTNEDREEIGGEEINGEEKRGREKDEISSIKTKETENKAEGAVNPWTFYCQGLHLQRLKETIKNRKSIDFILMEDVVSGFKFPCIMDLKMGDKMHKDYSNQEKYDRQAAKWNASTSKSLGVRIAGIQVYKDKSKKYVYLDKYYGFQLTEQSIKDEFIQFFHNGKHIRKRVVAALINKLQKLYRCIEEQKDSRFYSSSLLLIYEGFEEPCNSQEHFDGPDTDSKSSINKPEHDVMSTQGAKTSNGICTDVDKDLKSCLLPENKVKDQRSSLKENQPYSNGIHVNMNQELPISEKVEVKMIDFARSFHGQGKTTFDSCQDGPDKGPDEGYLLGLNSLLNLLKEIIMHH